MRPHDSILPISHREPRLAETLVVELRRGSQRWLVSQDWGEKLLGDAAPDWFSLGACAQARCVKQGNARTIWRVPVADAVVFAKVLDSPGLGRRLRQWLFGDGLRGEWRMGRELERRGVPVVRFLALGMLDADPPRSVLITEEFGGSKTLGHWNDPRRLFGAPIDRLRVRRMVECVAQLMAKSHAGGFAHRDVHPKNILVCPDSTVEAIPKEARFVDVHGGVLSWGMTARRWVIRSLAQLAHATRRDASRTDRMRFLRSYLRLLPKESAIPTGRDGRHALVRTVDKAMTVHAENLARHRDRRLGRSDTYFARFSPAAGWQAVVTLRLSRRNLFPEPHVPDRTLSTWRGMLARMIKDRRSAPDFDLQELQARDWVERLRWTILGSPYRRAFVECHRLRHRDQPSPLILAYADHRTFGLTDRSLAVRPASMNEGGGT